MSKTWSRDDIAQYIKQDLLIDRLQLGGGLKAQEIGDDMPLLDDGLALDSVDALDLVVSLEKAFGIKSPDPDRAFLERHCKNVAALTDYVQSQLAHAAA